MVEIFVAWGLQMPDKISPNFVETRKMCKTRPTLVMENMLKDLFMSHLRFQFRD